MKSELTHILCFPQIESKKQKAVANNHVSEQNGITSAFLIAKICFKNFYSLTNKTDKINDQQPLKVLNRGTKLRNKINLWQI